MSDLVSNRRAASCSLDLKDIIGEILSWLPVKSLLRFRCVCKAWRALISDPFFIRKHLSRINPRSTTSYSLLIKEGHFRSAECEAVLKCLSHDRLLSNRRLDFPVTDPLIEVANIAIGGSCHGLICLVLDFYSIKKIESFTFVLWNPCTGVYHVLPQPPLHYSKSYFWGFGYDSTADDYKVLLGSYKAGHEFVVVFSLKMGSWRQLERFNNCFGVNSVRYSVENSLGFLVNEALHWVLNQVGDGWLMPSKLVSFDLAEEKFHETPFPYPPDPEDRLRLIADVGVLNNCLTLYFQTNDCRPGCNFKMWMLKEYGVRNSWTEVTNIPSEVLDVEYIYMTCISENGEVLMRRTGEGSLTLYNPQEKKFRKVMDYGGYWHEICTYIETLVSPLTGSTGAAV